MPCAAMKELRTCFNVYDAVRRALDIAPSIERGDGSTMEHYEVHAQGEIAFLIFIHKNSCTSCRAEGVTASECGYGSIAF
jgi:hypothetical protein